MSKYWTPTHINNATGRTVRVIATGKYDEDDTPITVYEDSDGGVCARQITGFNGMSFTAIANGDASACFDLVTHLHRQKAFSLHTFGPGQRTAGVLDHIRKELQEVEKSPDDIMEWTDIILLALDGAWRAGHSPEAIALAINQKQTKNEKRSWPDWRKADPKKAIEHDRSAEAPEEAACVRRIAPPGGVA